MILCSLDFRDRIYSNEEVGRTLFFKHEEVGIFTIDLTQLLITILVLHFPLQSLLDLSPFDDGLPAFLIGSGKFDLEGFSLICDLKHHFKIYTYYRAFKVQKCILKHTFGQSNQTKSIITIASHIFICIIEFSLS